MRLYLSSYLLGDHPEELTRLVTGQRRGWIIANALDGLDEDRRRRDVASQIETLAGLGLTVLDLDLREHRPETIAEAIGEPDVLWVRGGNVFTLRAAMARSGIDRLIVDGLRRDAFVYAGFSAGPCVLAPSLAGLEQCDPISQCEAAYGTVLFDGLGILDRPVVPHLDSPGHGETELLGEVAARYRADGQAFWGLRDGQVLVVEGDRREIL